VDLGWGVVLLAVVGGSFDAVVFGEVAFDDAGVGSIASFWVEDFEDFGDGGGDGFMVLVRGESPLAR
jgi:hypothetical protein